MKKILFMLPNLNGGGAERVSVIIANILSRAGHEVHLVTAQEMGDMFNALDQGVNLHNLDYKKTILSVFGINKVIKKVQPEIVFSNLHRMNVVAFIVKKIFGGNYKLFMRLPNSPKAEFEYGQIGFFFKMILQASYMSADQIITQTPEMKQEAKKYFNLREKKISVLINPVDEKYIEKKILEGRAPFTKGINFVASGRLHYSKGFDVLIDAYAIVHKNIKNSMLHIIGADNGEEANLKKQVEVLGLSNNIIFHGFQENPYCYYEHCDLYILSSRYEGLPNTVLENLYLGKPIVATKCIPMLENLIEEGVNGYLVDKEDKEQLAQKIMEYTSLIPIKGIKNDRESIEKVFS